MDAQAQEQQAGRNAQDLAQEYAMSCYHIVFRVLSFLLSDIPGPRPISREDAHPMYPRYLRAFAFRFIISWFTAHSPTNLCEKGWGYHCRVLVRLLALYAKLN